MGIFSPELRPKKKRHNNNNKNNNTLNSPIRPSPSLATWKTHKPLYNRRGRKKDFVFNAEKELEASGVRTARRQGYYHDHPSPINPIPLLLSRKRLRWTLEATAQEFCIKENISHFASRMLEMNTMYICGECTENIHIAQQSV